MLQTSDDIASLSLPFSQSFSLSLSIHLSLSLSLFLSPSFLSVSNYVSDFISLSLSFSLSLSLSLSLYLCVSLYLSLFVSLFLSLSPLLRRPLSHSRPIIFFVLCHKKCSLRFLLVNARIHSKLRRPTRLINRNLPVELEIHHSAGRF